eukprot:Em0014g184a
MDAEEDVDFDSVHNLHGEAEEDVFNPSALEGDNSERRQHSSRVVAVPNKRMDDGDERFSKSYPATRLSHHHCMGESTNPYDTSESWLHLRHLV